MDRREGKERSHGGLEDDRRTGYGPPRTLMEGGWRDAMRHPTIMVPDGDRPDEGATSITLDAAISPSLADINTGLSFWNSLLTG